MRERASFPIDAFPEKQEAETLFLPFGFEIETFIDDPRLYLLVALKGRVRDAAKKVESL